MKNSMENMLSDSRALKVKLGILRKLRQWCTWHLRKQKTRKNPDKQTKQNKKWIKQHYCLLKVTLVILYKKGQ